MLSLFFEIYPSYNVHYTEKFHRNNLYTKNVSVKMLIKEPHLELQDQL